MRFLMLARRVSQTERVEKARPPRRSFRFVLSLALDCWANWDGGWGGADVDDCEGSSLWFEGAFS